MAPSATILLSQTHTHTTRTHSKNYGGGGEGDKNNGYKWEWITRLFLKVPRPLASKRNSIGEFLQ
jgi:hypothetical protein